MLAIFLLRRIDARLCIMMGLTAIAVGAFLGSHVTAAWGPWNFLPVVLLQTAGQSFAFLATIVYSIANSDPKRSTAVSAYIQVIRLGSAELAQSLMNTWLRQREQYNSNILTGLISNSSEALHQQTNKLQEVFGASHRGNLDALAAIAARVRAQATVLAYSDIFILSLCFALAALCLLAFLGSMPFGPLHPRFAKNPRPTVTD
ncbi:hypothetical protein [Rhizobium sp. WYJ-E13]|uniref:hypothetical protein n=1 Tax=Rhizobium sp. WYJ-E13 TaxID=2849093 RepID=UPI001C1EF967|nr:hypothetical protein [Rhizobium sp. WYJ-E13]QWW72522.1 hypothetical protein KQ933_31915 [Rhizobium sp. WYJ-E13]